MRSGILRKESYLRNSIKKPSKGEYWYCERNGSTEERYRTRRIARGYVVDFFHIRHWPVFNVADVALVVGVALLALQARSGRSGGQPAAESG
jgi:hypothetical protein